MVKAKDFDSDCVIVSRLCVINDLGLGDVGL